MFRKGLGRDALRMLQRMGVSFENIENVEEVQIIFKDKVIKLQNPNVTVAKISGQKIYQIISEKEIEEKTGITYTPTEEDIQVVMQQSKSTREEAVKALIETEGDIANAILLIKARKER